MRKIEDIQKMSIAELEKLMRESEFDTRDRAIISTEINARLLKVVAKPHWSVTSGFWLLVVGTSASCIAAYYSYLAYSQAQSPAAVVAPSKQIVQSVRK